MFYRGFLGLITFVALSFSVTASDDQSIKEKTEVSLISYAGAPWNEVAFSMEMPPPINSAKIFAKTDDEGRRLTELSVDLGRQHIELPDSILGLVDQPWIETLSLVHLAVSPSDPDWYVLLTLHYGNVAEKAHTTVADRYDATSSIEVTIKDGAVKEVVVFDVHSGDERVITSF